MHLDAPQNWKSRVDSDSYRVFLLCQLLCLHHQVNTKKQVMVIDVDGRDLCFEAVGSTVQLSDKSLNLEHRCARKSPGNKKAREFSIEEDGISNIFDKD